MCGVLPLTAGVRTASRALGRLSGELLLLQWCVVNEQCKVLDVLKCSFILIGLCSMIVVR